MGHCLARLYSKVPGLVVIADETYLSYPPNIMHTPSDIIRHSRLPAGNALWFCQIFYFYFLFFRRQGFRMITFDRQAGPLQNFNRSHVMVIGRSVLFSDPARPPGGGVGRPKHPKIPPPPKKKFQNPRNIFEQKKLVGKKNVFRPPPPKKNIFLAF